MAVLSRLPSNLSPLSPLSFELVIDSLPSVSYFCQSATLPGLTLDKIEQVSPNNRIPRPAVKLTYVEFSVTFMVDEDLTNYIELVLWLEGLGAPEKTQQYIDRVNNSRGLVHSTDSNIYSDATLIINTGQNNPNKAVRFLDCFPVSLAPITFNSRDASVEYLEAEVSFAYTRFEVENNV